MNKDRHPDVDVQITGEPSVKCPGCKTPNPRRLYVTDFPEENRAEVQKAFEDTAATGQEFRMFECAAEGCRKRYGVVVQQVTHLGTKAPPRAKGAPRNRHERRTQESNQRRGIA